jgi:5-formyltetrahydrofolate cyclo-ligase
MAQRRSAEEIQQILERYRASGLSQMEYCRQTGMVLSTLRRYLRRIDRPEQQLVRVKVEAPAEPGTGFVLMLGNGRRIASGWGFGDAELARLIRVAEGA